MSNEKNTLSLELKNSKNRKNIFAIIVSFIAAVTLAAGFCESAGISLFPYALIAAAIICAVFCIVPERFANYAGGALLLIIAAAAVIMRLDLLEGLKAIANSIFSASESRQAYLYTKFEITAGDRLSFCESLAITIIISALTLLFTYCAAKGFYFAPIAAMATAAGYEIYFGIAPSAPLNVAAFAVLALSTALCSERVKFKAVTAVILAAAICAASLGAYAVMPKQYRQGVPALHSFSEKVRDELTEGMQQYEEQPEEQKESGNAENETENGRGGTQKRASNPVRVNFTVLNFVLALSVILLLLAYLIALIFRNVKRSRLINSKDVKVSIASAFEYGFRYITAAKIERTNAIPSEYIGAVKSAYGKECADAYSESVAIYQEALYSTHDMTAEQADTMKNNYKKITAAVMKSSSVTDKIKIKLIKML